ncbi:MAG: bifunctional isocitrate dehydrogenase kinase/phosphatase [Thermodesulfobacteriota bacterium]
MTTEPLPDTVVSQGADRILSAYNEYQVSFTEITRRAADRFNRRDWKGMHQDAMERLDVYSRRVSRAVDRIQDLLANVSDRERVLTEMKSAFAVRVADRDDWELAETFFNSVIRRVFSTVGVNPGMEFTAADFKVPYIEDRTCPVCTLYGDYVDGGAGIRDMIGTILAGYATRFPYQDINRDVDRIADAVTAYLAENDLSSPVKGVEMIDSVFYRDNAAYLIGRMRIGERILPLVIALLSEPSGVTADAVLLTEEEVSILFSFTRSYFHVEVDRPAEMVNFLKTIIPLKRVSEIYTSLGFHKHGKAELYRELTRNLAYSKDRFQIARGKKGMVMLVFTLPSFDVVFKIIKDSFEYPKTASREEVMNRYDLVFRHDRAGRLVDAQEFEHMRFDRKRFSDALLEEMRKHAQQTVEIRDDHVVIKHLYTERRLSPLDLYLKEAGEEAARDAVVDYGRAIKELAASNIFPGDLFLKNFGVTRHGRVVFYDYDELCLLTDCRFRKIPKSRGYTEEMSSEPWYFVGEQDVFPEEFRTFLRFPEGLGEVFEKVHGDLFDVKFWRTLQERLRSNGFVHIFPYKQRRRFEKQGRG